MLIDLFGAGVRGKSSNLTAQRRLNVFPELRQEVDKAGYVLFGRPGLTSLPSTVSNGGVTFVKIAGRARGMQRVYWTDNAPKEYLVLVYGSAVCFMSSLNDSRVTFNGPPLITNPVMGTGPVCIADSGDSTRGVITTGIAGYIVDVTQGPISQAITSANFPQTARTCCYLAGRVFVDDPSQAGQFRWSNLLNPTTWDALDFDNAQATSDPLVAVYSARGELMLFGSNSLEFWAPDTGTNVVSRIGGTTLGWGCASPFSIQTINDTVIFLGRNAGGTLQVAMLQGYQAKAVSTPDVEFDIANDPIPAGLSSAVFSFLGHTFYVLNLANTSWVYDVTTGIWSEFSTGTGVAPWAGALTAPFQGETIVADATTNDLYKIDGNALTDNGQTIAREFITKHVSQDFENPLTISRLQLDMETGAANQSTTLPNYAPQIMAQMSKDGGHTWGNEMWVSLGAIGEYLTRAVWRRLGRGYDFLFKFRVTDPVKIVAMKASIEVSK
jgi:hypothetical protein